ncbi:UNVERIFIED_CONTAM: hypothetical protein Sradi_3155800 [Sesamum radiatum]|uniref:Uncharacterized protein n=1 Tax=Sesamum radiatum TaxID=300843 RepID=A0AAW2RF84_SESRA
MAVRDRSPASKTLHCRLRPPWPMSSVCGCQQLAVEREAKYSVSALRPTTLLLDHHSPTPPLLQRPRHHNRTPQT